MDLISRDKAQEIIPKVVLGMSDFAECIRDSVDSVFDNCPSAFEGMTNGEVMKAVFPKISVFENIDVRYPYMDVFYPNESDMPMHSYKKDWWNAPYKAESEVKQDD